VEACYDVPEQLRKQCHEDDVIDIEEQVGDAVAIFVHKERGIGLAPSEANDADVFGEPLVPSSAHLLESIHGLLQLADVVRRHVLLLLKIVKILTN